MQASQTQNELTAAQAREAEQAAAHQQVSERLKTTSEELAGSRAEVESAGEALAAANARVSDKAAAIEQLQQEKVNLF